MSNGYKLIVVDDEWVIRDGLMNYHWSSLGFHAVGGATNGEEALRLYEDVSPEVVLTDIRMPGMDGLQLAANLQNINPNCKVVILTGVKEFEYARNAIKFGAISYLLKPVDTDELDSLFIKLKKQLDDRQKDGKNKKNSLELTIDSTETSIKPTSLLVEYPNEGNNIQQISKEFQQSTDSSGLRPLFLQEALVYITHEFRRKLSLEEVSAKVFVSPAYFSHQFKKYMGMNYIKYLKQIRMEHARGLLSRPDLKIYEVGQRVGYNNPKYFTDAFHAYTGMTPHDYRIKSANSGTER